MTDGSNAQPESAQINLKDPFLAAFLAWLIPGLGHLYQGRIAKGVLFFVCIMGLFVYGVYLGGSDKLGFGRAVYCSFRSGELRIHYLGQIFVGLPAMPACVQAIRMNNGKAVLFNGFMAPPRSLNVIENDPNIQQPTKDNIERVLNRNFELASTLTLIAGLLNILAIYDAFSGPVAPIHAKKAEHPEKTEKH